MRQDTTCFFIFQSILHMSNDICIAVNQSEFTYFSWRGVFTCQWMFVLIFLDASHFFYFFQMLDDSFKIVCVGQVFDSDGHMSQKRKHVVKICPSHAPMGIVIT